MPPLPRITCPMLVELARELRYAPRARLLKTVEKAEALAADLAPEASLPAEWVVFRLTGYRPERWPDAPELATATGRELLHGLSALTELLTHQAEWTWTEAQAAGAVDRAALAGRWGVSLKTLDRMKAEGLTGRRAKRPDGKVVLAFLPAVVAAAEKRRAPRAAAPAATRMSPAQRLRAIALAARFHRRFGCTLNQTAVRLAARIDRSVETVRQLLRGEEERRAKTGAPPVFGEAGPVQESGRRWIERAWRRGAEPADLARRVRCGRPAVQRAINLVRLGWLEAWIAAGALSPGAHAAPRTSDPAELAGRPLLKHPRVSGELGRPGATDLAYLVESARTRLILTQRDERAMIEAYHLLRTLAVAWARSTPRLNPQSEPLDAAETALRWAARLKVELIRPLWPLMLETIETVAGTPVDAIDPGRLIPLLDTQLAVAAHAVDQADPVGGGRLAGAAALDLSTAASRWLKANPAPASTKGRAARSIPQGIEVPDWTRRVAPWQDRLEPDRRIRPLLGRLTAPHAEVLGRRMGWNGQRPMTQTETAAALGVSRLALPRLERAATRAALALAREPG